MNTLIKKFFLILICVVYLGLSACGGVEDGDGSGDGGGDPGVVSPSTPSEFQTTLVTSSSITLVWNDVSGETGYRLERSIDESNYAEVAIISADSTVYMDDIGLSSATQYYYRLYAFNSAGDSNFATTNTTTLLPPVTNYTLTVIKSGTGNGTVYTSGINCGSNCTEQYESGISVTLEATPAVHSMFVRWSGCDSSIGSSCTVSMNSDKMVTSVFSPALTSGITLLLLPDTDIDGTYTLTWNFTGSLMPSNLTIQEDSDISFSSPTTYTSYDTTPPYQHKFYDKVDGKYCYRIFYSNAWSVPACITVMRPETAILRIINNSQYDMIDIRLNGVQEISYPYGIPPGSQADFSFTSPLTISMNLGVGNYNSDGSRDIWFTYSKNTSLTTSKITQIEADPITITQLLTHFQNSCDWYGVYYCYNCPTLINSARFNFTSTGGWTFYDNGVRSGSGTVELVSWPNYASVVTFRLCSECQNIYLVYPFGTFDYKNGPPDWPVITYVSH